MKNARLLVLIGLAVVVTVTLGVVFARLLSDRSSKNPRDTAEYVNSQAKFRFTYPTAWGQVKMMDQQTASDKQAYTFTAQPNIIFKVHARTLADATDDKLYSAVSLVNVTGSDAQLTKGAGQIEQKTSQADLNGSPCIYEEKPLSLISGEAGPNDRYLLGYCEAGAAEFGGIIFDGGMLASNDDQYDDQKDKLTGLLKTFRAN